MNKKILTPFLLLAFCCTGCLYEMPSEDTADTRPQTNNPNYVRQAADSGAPTFNY